MALTVKPISFHSLKGPLRGQKGRTFVLTPDASKPAAGYTVLASALGFTYLDFGVAAACQGDPLSYRGDIKIGTASTDCTIQFYSLSAASTASITNIGAALPASATVLTTNPLPIYVIGR